MEAPAEARTDRWSRVGLTIAALTCASVVVSHIFGRFSYSLLLPALKEDLVDSNTGAGFLGASYFAGYLLGVIGVTVVASRVRPTTLLRAGLGLSALALMAMATAPRFSVLASAVFFAGLAGAGIWIPAPTIATSRVPPERRGLVMGALTAAMGVGMLVVSQGTTLWRSIADDDGLWRPLFGAEAAVTVLILLGVVLFVPRLSGGAPEAPPESALERTATFSLDGLRSIPHWGLLALAYTAYATLAGAWAQFLGVAMEEDAGFSRAHVNNLYSVLAIAAIPGALLIGRLSDRIGRDRAIAVSAAMSVGASLLLPLDQEPFAAIAAGLYGAGSFALPPLAAGAVRDHLEGSSFATAFGAMTVVYAMVSMIASQLAGVLSDATGSFDAVYLSLAAAGGLVGAIALRRAALLG